MKYLESSLKRPWEKSREQNGYEQRTAMENKEKHQCTDDKSIQLNTVYLVDALFK